VLLAALVVVAALAVIAAATAGVLWRRLRERDGAAASPALAEPTPHSEASPGTSGQGARGELSGQDGPEPLADPAAQYRRAQRRLVHDVLTRQGVGLVYQPIVDLRDDRIIGWEALLRATSSSLGALPAPLMVESAAASGRLDELTWVVAERALATTSRAADLAGEPFTLTVNIELEQLRGDSALLDRLVAAYDPSRVRLVLEISERGVGAWASEHTLIATALADRGIACAMDDLGSGQSSAPILLRHAWDYIKLDRTFLQGDPAGVALVVGRTVGLVHDLGMIPVMEGVETPAQLEMLRGLGVGLVQGNLLFRPLVEADLFELVGRSMVAG
jgi:EAL domain-containing protein (putative c-di-GMP-specific phosphodiesterase class I)